MIPAPMTPEQQLGLWVAGHPTHNAERDECTPDLSCCTPAMLWMRENREAFQDADEAERTFMLAAALVGIVAHREIDVVIRATEVVQKRIALETHKNTGLAPKTAREVT